MFACKENVNLQVNELYSNQIYIPWFGEKWRLEKKKSTKYK